MTAKQIVELKEEFQGTNIVGALKNFKKCYLTYIQGESEEERSGLCLVLMRMERGSYDSKIGFKQIAFLNRVMEVEQTNRKHSYHYYGEKVSENNQWWWKKKNITYRMNFLTKMIKQFR